jgi:hypothetical protein
MPPVFIGLGKPQLHQLLLVSTRCEEHLPARVLIVLNHLGQNGGEQHRMAPSKELGNVRLV